MAFMNQTRKAELAPGVKSVLKKYGVKGTLSTSRHSITLTLTSGKIDFIGNFNKVGQNAHPRRMEVKRSETLGVNTYWYHEHFSQDAKAFLDEVLEALNKGNHDNSDIQTDYFDVGWYTYVNIGKWNKPYEVV